MKFLNHHKAFCSLILAVTSVIGCKVPNRYYCDSATPCTLAERPYCDLIKEECEATIWDGFVAMDMSFQNDGMVECSNSNSCTSQSKPICDATSVCVGCSTDLQCKGKNVSIARCDTTSGSCVACVAAPNAQQSSDCDPATPICDGTSHTCRACKAHSDCTSLVCNLDGTCADSSTVAYVDNANGACSGAHGGTQADPICDLQMGISAGKTIVRVAGSSVAYSKLSISSGTVTIIGPGQKGVSSSAKVSGDLSNPAATISGSSTVVTFDGIEVTGGGSVQDGIYCSQASVGPTLTVKRSYIHGVGGAGINVSRCKVILDRNQIGPGCSGGAVALSGAQYSITNNFIIGNASTTTAAVSFNSGSSELAGGSGFRANTIAKNGNLAGVAGIQCNAGTTEIRDSIVWTNTGGDTGGGGTCNLTNVAVSASPIDFVDAMDSSSYDFHLSGRSTNNNACCIDKISITPVPVDYDGRARPQPRGGMSDIGAHEVP